jgi:hypothetical protein
METKKKGVSDFPENRDNPFLEKLMVPVKSKSHAVATSKNDIILNTITGEHKEDALFLATKKSVDAEEFVKIFQGSMAAIFGLSKAAQRVFNFVFSVIKPSQDTLIFRVDDCKEATGYNSIQTIYSGLAELLDNEFIAKSDITNVFYINPQIFYKGDRLIILREYRRKKAKEKEKDPTQLDLWAESERRFEKEKSKLKDIDI